jgi:hypothetical protein
MFILLVLLASSLLPQAAAGADCVALATTTFGEGLRVVASTGSQLAFGIVSGEPGEGVGAVVIITPSACGPLHVDATGTGTQGNNDDPETILHSAPRYLPLP